MTAFQLFIIALVLGIAVRIEPCGSVRLRNAGGASPAIERGKAK
jgi:hypothetical protein